MTTACIILAGGLARRMGGGDKTRLTVGGKTILARTIACLTPQVRSMAINANGDPAHFADTGLPILPDTEPGHPGPLAGILAGLDWAALDHEWLVSVSGDCPFLPSDLVARLHHARAQTSATYAVAASAGWTHPTIGLWPTACRETLRTALRGGMRKIDAFATPAQTARAEWVTDPLDPFFNVNTPEDLAEAERLTRMDPP